MAYGKELILDLYGCDSRLFNRKSIEEWLKKLCGLIDMEREDLHWWDYQECSEEEKKDAPAHLLGTTAVQFITTSDIRIHVLDILKECYINIFSCKEFDKDVARKFTLNWFGASSWDEFSIGRGKRSSFSYSDVEKVLRNL